MRNIYNIRKVYIPVEDEEYFYEREEIMATYEYRCLEDEFPHLQFKFVNKIPKLKSDEVVLSLDLGIFYKAMGDYNLPTKPLNDFLFEDELQDSCNFNLLSKNLSKYTLKDLIENFEDILQRVSINDSKMLFVKSNDKRVLSGALHDKFSIQSVKNSIPLNTELWVAADVYENILSEHRFYVPSVNPNRAYEQAFCSLYTCREDMNPIFAGNMMRELAGKSYVEEVCKWKESHFTGPFSFDVAMVQIDDNGFIWRATTNVVEAHYPWCIGNYGMNGLEWMQWLCGLADYLEELK